MNWCNENMAELLLSEADFTHLWFSDLTVVWWSKQENKTTNGVKLYNLAHIFYFFCFKARETLKEISFTCTDETKVRTYNFTLCHAGRIRTHGIGGGHKQKYRMIDFQRLRYEEDQESKPFEEKVVEVRYDPCR